MIMSRMSELSSSTAATFFSQYDVWYVFYVYMVCKKHLSFYSTQVRISTVRHNLFALRFLQ